MLSFISPRDFSIARFVLFVRHVNPIQQFTHCPSPLFNHRAQMLYAFSYDYPMQQLYNPPRTLF